MTGVGEVSAWLSEPLGGEQRRTRPSSSPGANGFVRRCPWARTTPPARQAQADISDNLLEIGHFPSIGARFPAVVCRLMPAETTAKLRPPDPRTEPNGAGKPDKPPSDWRRRSECVGGRCGRRLGTAPGHADAKGWCTPIHSDPRRYREPVPWGSHPARR